MKVLRLEIRRFRGFESLSITPSGHVVLVGEPGAGRSDVIEGLERVLWVDSTRARMPTDLDFFGRDTKRRAEVEVTLGELGDALEQQFFDHLELWDREQKAIIAELGDPQLIDRAVYELAVRLCYRIRWNASEDLPEHWVDYAKSSDPDSGVEDRVARAEREAIPFAGRTGGRPLDLNTRGVFRRLVEGMEGGDFAGALSALEQGITEVAGSFSETAQVSASLSKVLDQARLPLRLGERPAAEVVRFLPEGGSLAGLVRSLGPAVDLGDGPGHLPLQRHGSTVAAVLTAAQSIAAIGDAGIVAIDDLGESLDAACTQHLAATIRKAVGQVWLSTRRPQAIDAFEAEEIVRLARDGEGRRQVFYGKRPTSKGERLAARHLSTQLLPALASRSLIVVEGPHDREALTALARRLHDEAGIALPAAHGITLVDAAAADGSGGSSALPRLSRLARDLGLWAVAVIDHDGAGEQVERELEAALAHANAVVRLPAGHAIEKALLSGLPVEVVRATVREVAEALTVTLPARLDELQGANLVSLVAKFLKQAGGLHSQFVAALPAGQYPPVAQQVLAVAVSAAAQRRSGHIQL